LDYLLQRMCAELLQYLIVTQLQFVGLFTSQMVSSWMASHGVFATMHNSTVAVFTVIPAGGVLFVIVTFSAFVL
jgi:ribulose 1,5-bisphosphate carboxylase large subunit-like protein